MSFHNELTHCLRENWTDWLDRLAGRNSETIDKQAAMLFELRQANKELEAENARLRQQRDAANAQLDFLIEEMNKAP